MMIRTSYLGKVYLSVMLLAGWAVASPAAAGEAVDYVRDVRPILAEKCFACHGALKQESSLRLDAASLMLRGGENGAAIVPGRSGASHLVERVTAADDDERMPPAETGPRLTPAQIVILKVWIDQGAKAPRDEPVPPDPRKHWAFQPPQRPMVPQVERPGWSKNPIDALLADAQRRRVIDPVQAAEPHVLLRRVHLDLVGLPPTRGELESFLANPSDAAYRDLVDRLLASPHYGERWGRHWMDVWRYSDWSGELDNQVRGSPRHIWHWRDWIIESLNADKGYDRMIVEMLAGDEIAPDDPRTIRATGFLARNFYRFNRDVWLDDTVEHTAKAFLGLTVNCARCHDHKFDPLSQRDYYRLKAIFQPHYVGNSSLGQRDDEPDRVFPRVYDREPETATYLFHRGDPAQPDKSRPLSPGVSAVLGGQFAVRKINLPPEAIRAEPINNKKNKKKPAQPPAETFPTSSTGRRLALARWIVDRRNPLTARVAVNHVWMRHFGRPLVEGVFDFGLRAPRPRQAELLDWLAVELMDHGWSMKHLHRLIVTSRAYRLRSFARGGQRVNAVIDGGNHYLWRANPRRMEAEVIRDAMLHVAGRLDTTAGGPEIPLSEGETSLRRGVYFRHAHERQVPLLETFDGAGALECYRRSETIVPQQALALVNGDLPIETARLLARRLAEETAREQEPARAFIEAAFECVLCRRPSGAEMDRCLAFLKDHTARLEELNDTTQRDVPGKSPDKSLAGRVGPASDPAVRARENLVHALLNHNDFITIR